jgi:hypothetical protein
MIRKQYFMALIVIALITSSYVSITNVHRPYQQFWETSANWRLYKTNDSNGFSYSLERLKTVYNLPLNTDSMRLLLSNAKPADLRGVMWMGYYTATCEFPGGKKDKIEISQYGGFLLDQSTGVFYQLPPETIETWQKYLIDKRLSLDQ